VAELTFKFLRDRYSLRDRVSIGFEVSKGRWLLSLDLLVGFSVGIKVMLWSDMAVIKEWKANTDSNSKKKRNQASDHDSRIKSRALEQD